MTDYSGTITPPDSGYFLNEWTVMTVEQGDSDTFIGATAAPLSDGSFSISSPDDVARLVTIMVHQPFGEVWEAGKAVSSGDYIRPTSFSGFVFRCQNGGTLGQSEPAWPLNHGATIMDNDAELVAVQYLGVASDKGKFVQGPYFAEQVLPDYWTPAALASLALWLKDTGYSGSSGDTIGTWEDESGNQYDAVQTSPDNAPSLFASWINNKDVLSFDGNDYMDLAPTSWGDYVTIFCVEKKDNASSQSAILDCASNLSFSSSNGFRFDRFNANFRFGVNGTFLTESLSSTQTHILIARYDGTEMVIWRDGNVVGTTSKTGPIDYSNCTSYLAAHTGVNNRYGGVLAEVGLVSEAIADGDVDKLAGYLAHQWGLEGNLPSSHPYADSPPLL